MTNKEKQELMLVLDALIKDNLDNLDKNQFVIISNEIKILKVPRNNFTVKYHSKWFYFDNDNSKFNIIVDIPLHEYNIKNSTSKELDKFQVFLWDNNYVNVYNVEEINNAKENKINVIVKEGDIELTNLEQAAITNENYTEQTIYLGKDCWLFKFSDATEIIRN